MSPCWEGDKSGQFKTTRTPVLSTERITALSEVIGKRYSLAVDLRIKREQEVALPTAPVQTLVSAEQKRREYEKLQQEMRETEAKAAARREAVQKMEEDLARLRRRDIELSSRERDLMSKEREAEQLARDLNREQGRLTELDRSLRTTQAQLSTKEEELNERQRQEEAEQRQRFEKASSKAAALEAGFEAAHGQEIRRWQEESYQQARKALGKVKKALRAGDLPKVHLIAEQARARLEEIEKQAFEDERIEEERKETVGILVAALNQLGYHCGAEKRDQEDPRSHVDVMGEMPSGKGIWYTVRHGASTEIRQLGVGGHQECHSVEDAIAAATSPMGLTFSGGYRLTARGKRPAGPGIRASAKAKG